METVWKNRANEILGHYYTSAKEQIRLLASAVSWLAKKKDWWQEQLKEFPPSSSSLHTFFQPAKKITLCSGQSIKTKVPVVVGAEHICWSLFWLDRVHNVEEERSIFWTNNNCDRPRVGGFVH